MPWIARAPIGLESAAKYRPNRITPALNFLTSYLPLTTLRVSWRNSCLRSAEGA